MIVIIVNIVIINTTNSVLNIITRYAGTNTTLIQVNTKS